MNDVPGLISIRRDGRVLRYVHSTLTSSGRRDDEDAALIWTDAYPWPIAVRVTGINPPRLRREHLSALGLPDAPIAD